MIKLSKLFICSLLLTISLISYAQTNEEIQALANQGDALGQAKLSSLYLLGKNGVEKDDKKAAEWMMKAAEQGLVEAQVSIAAMYDRGIGVVSDKNKATKWYEKAAKQGHTTSLAILGKNPTAKGSVQFSYERMRFNAARAIPREYAKRFLLKK